MTFHFDVEIAKKYGVEEAVVFQNLKFWIIKNASDGANFRDGAYWTYTSSKALAKLFPFWDWRKVLRLLDSLIKQKAIVRGEYRDKMYNLWYKIIDEETSKEIAKFVPEEGEDDSPSYKKEEDILPKMVVHTTENGRMEGCHPTKNGSPITDITYTDITSHITSTSGGGVAFIKLVYDTWEGAGLPTSRPFASWVTTNEASEVARGIKGIHSDKVFKAIHDYASCLDKTADSWVTTRVSIARFFGGKLFSAFLDGTWMRERKSGQKEENLSDKYFKDEE